MKFCVDCRWHEMHGQHHMCGGGCINEVTGRPRILSCEEARLGPCRGGCNFTPKDYDQYATGGSNA